MGTLQAGRILSETDHPKKRKKLEGSCAGQAFPGWVQPRIPEVGRLKLVLQDWTRGEAEKNETEPTREEDSDRKVRMGAFLRKRTVQYEK